MLRLVGIEYFKLKNTRYFWVLGLLFLAFLVFIPFGTKYFLDYMTSRGADMNGISASDIPIFDFVDIWQNMTWIYQWFTILLGFVSIISITTEFRNTTLRQGIIDGLSRREFMWSKVGMIFILSLVVSVTVLVVGLIAGSLWSPVTGWDYITMHIEFVPAYFLHLFSFQLLCLFVGILLKRSGISIALIMFYFLMIEPVIYWVLRGYYKLELIPELLPMQAFRNLVPNPLPKYGFQEIQNYVGMPELMVVLAYIGILLFSIFLLLKKRDL